MYDFKKKSHFLYDYEHQDLIYSVLVSEEFKLAMSGGWDETLMLHGLESGKTIKRFDMKYGSLRCLFDLGTAVAVGDWNSVRLLDLQTRDMKKTEVEAGGYSIYCMNLGIRGSDQKNRLALLVGGQNSNKMDKISILKAIAGYGRNILEMRNRPKNTEKNQIKMTDLKNENKRLRKENQRLKDMLKKEENKKKYAISKFEKKILELSDEVKTQETINAQLQEELNLIENQLTTTQKENEILTKSNKQQQQKLDDLNSQLRKQKKLNHGTPNLKISKTKSTPFCRQTIRLTRTTENYPKRSKTFKRSSSRASPKVIEMKSLRRNCPRNQLKIEVKGNGKN